MNDATNDVTTNAATKDYFDFDLNEGYRRVDAAIENATTEDAVAAIAATGEAINEDAATKKKGYSDTHRWTSSRKNNDINDATSNAAIANAAINDDFKFLKGADID